MVRQLGLVAVLAAAVALVSADSAFARGHKGCSSCGSCGSSGSCGSCGAAACATCGTTSHAAAQPCSSCAGGVCYAPATGHASAAAAASLIVTLPADAKLTIDDHLTTSTSDTRQFTTPSLSSEKDYHYTLKAEVIRGGQVVSVTKEVTVRAGQETRISLDIPATVAAK